MASPPHSGVPSSTGNVVGGGGSTNSGGAAAASMHEHHAALLMQQQQQQVDYYQNPAAIYSQMHQQQQQHYGNGGGGSADLLATQQYLQNLQLGGDPNLDGSGKKGLFKIKSKSFCFPLGWVTAMQFHSSHIIISSGGNSGHCDQSVRGRDTYTTDRANCGELITSLRWVDDEETEAGEELLNGGDRNRAY